ncbi:unnamed protein product, partial [Ectocarpus sp. 12 AP-2014]
MRHESLHNEVYIGFTIDAPYPIQKTAARERRYVAIPRVNLFPRGVGGGVLWFAHGGPLDERVVSWLTLPNPRNRSDCLIFGCMSFAFLPFKGAFSSSRSCHCHSLFFCLNV